MAKYPKTLGRIEAVWNKLGGEEGVDRFLAGELTVVEKNGAKEVVSLPTVLLRLLTSDLVLDATAGSETLSKASNVFNYIDDNLKYWGCDVAGEATAEARVSVHEMVQDGTFQQLFGSFGIDLDQLCLSQAQIKQFCLKHEDQFRTDGYGTFFLFKVGEEFFVARVYRNEPRSLGVDVDRLAYDYVWGGEDRHRVVVPQLVS